MGRKRRHLVVLKPFCYYCDKEFNNEIILHQHQKARHFNCTKCKKRFSTAPALDTHSIQVHKDRLSRVPNAKAGRDTFDISIYGMDGVPIELINYKLAEKVQNKKSKLIQEHKLIDDEVIEEKNQRLHKDDESNIKNILSNSSGGFYHNPDSINLTLKQKQMTQMYTNPSSVLANGYGSGPTNLIQFPGNLPMHMQSQLQTQIQGQIPMSLPMQIQQVGVNINQI